MLWLIWVELHFSKVLSEQQMLFFITMHRDRRTNTYAIILSKATEQNRQLRKQRQIQVLKMRRLISEPDTDI